MIKMKSDDFRYFKVNLMSLALINFKFIYCESVLWYHSYDIDVQ